MLEKLIKAITEQDKQTVNTLLADSPGLLNEALKSEFKVFFVAAKQRKYDILDHLTSHRSFHALSLLDKYELYRSIVDGLHEDGQVLSKMKTKLTSVRLKLAAVCILGIKYSKQIKNKNDLDYYRLGSLHFLLGNIFAIDNTKSHESTQNEWDSAVRAYRKIKNKVDADHINIAMLNNRLANSFSRNQNYREALNVLNEAQLHCRLVSQECLTQNKAGIVDTLERNLIQAHRAVLTQEARKWGCETHEINSSFGQVSALYQVIQDQLALLGDDMKISFTLADFYRLKPENDAIAGELRGNLPPDFDLYIGKLIQEGIWTAKEAIHILMISRLLNMNLVFLRSDGEQPIIIKALAPHCTLYFGLNIREGYLSLRRNPDLTPNKSIRDYISCAPTGHSPKKVNPERQANTKANAFIYDPFLAGGSDFNSSEVASLSSSSTDSGEALVADEVKADQVMINPVPLSSNRDRSQSNGVGFSRKRLFFIPKKSHDDSSIPNKSNAAIGHKRKQVKLSSSEEAPSFHGSPAALFSLGSAPARSKYHAHPKAHNKMSVILESEEENLDENTTGEDEMEKLSY